MSADVEVSNMLDRSNADVARIRVRAGQLFSFALSQNASACAMAVIDRYRQKFIVRATT